jgi:hypothetical protein
VFIAACKKKLSYFFRYFVKNEKEKKTSKGGNEFCINFLSSTGAKNSCKIACRGICILLKQKLIINSFDCIFHLPVNKNINGGRL